MNNVALSFGEALIDFRRSNPDHSIGLPAFVAHPGGAPANVAVAIAKLGAHSAFIGMLSRDPFGNLLCDQMAQAGVDLTYTIRTANAQTALAFVDHDCIGDRNFTFYRQSSADLRFRTRHFQEKAFARASVFHACSNSLTETKIAKATFTGMLRARAKGILISFDMNLRPALWNSREDPMPRLLEAMAISDLIKLSAEEFDFACSAAGGYETFVNHLWQHAPRLLIVTDGPNPVRWFTPTGQGFLPVISRAPVDPTGAGDAFMGGMLYRYIADKLSVQELTALSNNPGYRNDLLRFACACGTASVMQTGSFSAMPTLGTVRSLLASRL